jgi:PhoH-like ATPase
MARKKKIFVLDTNVILHDSSCIYQFKSHDIVLPITVLEELDQFKKGNASINYHAREFIRTLDELSGDGLFNDGVKIGPNRGKISMPWSVAFMKIWPSIFPPKKPITTFSISHIVTPKTIRRAKSSW